MENMGLSHVRRNQDKLKIIFSIQSSGDPVRNFDFNLQIHSLRGYLESKSLTDVAEIVVERMSSISVEEQMTMAAESSVYITAAGGGAMTAMFLPPGGSLIVFYNDQGSNWKQGRPYNPALLDWDYFNSATYLHTSWMPISEMNDEGKLDLLNKMVGSEIERWLDDVRS